MNRIVVKKFCDVSCSLKKRKLYQKSKDDKVEFTLGVKIGSASLDFFVRFCNGQLRWPIVNRSMCTWTR